ncbi:MAG: zinc metallopeptidase [Eubacterium sp.]|nr:zinc metallopeptidase [Eubacterium sp.]
MRNGYYYGFDWTYLLVIVALILTLAVQAKMNSTFSKYSKIASMSGMTGAMAAQKILESEGLYNVRVEHVSGSLTDHYDPRTKVVNLSDAVYAQRSLAAIGVAAHECGHAIQDAQDYQPLRLRTALVPAANIGSTAAWPLFLFGLILSFRPLLTIGILLFCAALLFQIVTLPVEFNASHRALKKLESTGLMASTEITGSRKVLSAAAMTYVAAVASSLLQLLRLVLLAGGGRRRN